MRSFFSFRSYLFLALFSAVRSLKRALKFVPFFKALFWARTRALFRHSFEMRTLLSTIFMAIFKMRAYILKYLKNTSPLGIPLKRGEAPGLLFKDLIVSSMGSMAAGRIGPSELRKISCLTNNSWRVVLKSELGIWGFLQSSGTFGIFEFFQ